jgi:hypothetical protein
MDLENLLSIQSLGKDSVSECKRMSLNFELKLNSRLEYLGKFFVFTNKI